jgi:hypothetical protein
MATFTSTTTATYTITHTAAWLAGAIVGTISELLGHLGIAVSAGALNIAQDENAIAAWYQECSLKEVVLECHRPDGGINPIFEFPVTYSPHSVSYVVAFQTDRASLARYQARLATVPAGTRYKLFCTFNGAHSAQPGWGPATRSSTEGLRSSNFGTLATGPHGSASMRTYQ